MTILPQLYHINKIYANNSNHYYIMVGIWSMLGIIVHIQVRRHQKTSLTRGFMVCQRRLRTHFKAILHYMFTASSES